MVEIGIIHIDYDIDDGIVLTVETTSVNSKYNCLEGRGENIHDALSQLIENVESLPI
jgi:hypothetical protein